MNDDLISRSALVESLRDSYNKLSALYNKETAPERKLVIGGQLIVFAEAILRTKDAPAVDAEPVRYGHWTKYNECSECGELALYNGNEEHVRSRSCPNCGAKMEGENNG